MAIARWRRSDLPDPVAEFDRLRDEINKLFDFDYGDEANGLFDRRVSPAIDVVEQSDEFVVTCDLPGVDEKDLDISIANNVLTIKGEKKDPVDADKQKVYRRETWAGTFQRTLSLPDTIDAEKIEAEIHDGILTVTLPKREEIKPRQISVKVS